MLKNSRLFALCPSLAFAGAFLAASCGDDSKGSGGGGESGSVKTVADLGTCLSAFEGDTYRVEEMDGDYRCEGGKWVALSSLGECTDSLSRAGAVRMERNRGLDGYGTGYACRDSAWTPATDVEVALGSACAEDLDGALRKDTTSKKGKTYICASGNWREATEAERAAGALCAKDNENAFATDSSDRKDVKVWVCKDSLWTEASSVERATRSVCSASLRGTFAADSSEKSLPLYVCDSTEYGWSWRVASEAEGMTRLLCDGSVEGDTVSFHVCTPSGWERDTTSTLGACTEKRSGEVATEGNPFRIEGLNATASDSGYVCDGSSWRKATAGERATGKLCTEKVDGDTLNWYVCDASSNDWTAIMTTGLPECSTERLDTVATEPNPNLGRGDSLYVCADTGSSEYAWKKLETSLLGTCDAGLQDSVRAEPNVNLETYGQDFVCDAGKWREAGNYDIENGVPCTDNLRDVVVGSLLCGSDGKWRAATDEELDMGAACTEASEGTLSVEKGKTCRDGEWVSATAVEKATGFVCAEKTASTTVTNGFVCDASSGTYAFREATSVEKMTGYVCAKENFDLVSSGYVCRKDSSGAYKWRLATAGERATGKKCSMESQYELNGGYVCQAGYGDADSLSAVELAFCLLFMNATDSVGAKEILSSGTFAATDCNVWREETDREKFLGKTCIPGVNDSQYVFKDSMFLCVNGVWKIPSFGMFTDLRDGQAYKMVQIGSQTWMAENLNYNYRYGTAMSYCYDDNADSCKIYGRLYTWAAAMDSAAIFSDDGKGCGYAKCCYASGKVRGVCPEGWHLPDSTEWNTLMAYVAANTTGGEDSVGYALKSTSGWKEFRGKSANGSDLFGFGALPTGFRTYEGNFMSVREFSFLHSTSEGVVGYCDSYNRVLYLGYSFEDCKFGIISYDYTKKTAYPVRCVKD